MHTYLDHNVSVSGGSASCVFKKRNYGVILKVVVVIKTYFGSSHVFFIYSFVLLVNFTSSPQVVLLKLHHSVQLCLHPVYGCSGFRGRRRKLEIVEMK